MSRHQIAGNTDIHIAHQLYAQITYKLINVQITVFWNVTPCVLVDGYYI